MVRFQVEEEWGEGDANGRRVEELEQLVRMGGRVV